MKYLACICIFLVSGVAFGQGIPPSLDQLGGVTRILDAGDERDWEVARGFSFTDSQGLVWTVYPGYRSDLASIPFYLRPLVGDRSNYEFLHASLLHDQYIDCKSRTTLATNEAFYELLIAFGVSEAAASRMLSAVTTFGPNWEVGEFASDHCPIDFLDNDVSMLDVWGTRFAILDGYFAEVSQARDTTRQTLATLNRQVWAKRLAFKSIQDEIAFLAQTELTPENTEPLASLATMADYLSQIASEYAALSNERIALRQQLIETGTQLSEVRSERDRWRALVTQWHAR